MSQERIGKEDTATASRGVTAYSAPDIDASLSRATSVMQKVRVVHGANEQYFDNLQGKTVGTIRKSLREVFNIPGDAVALIAGKEVGDDFIMEGGMSLEFSKEAGVKGCKKKTSFCNRNVQFGRKTHRQCQVVSSKNLRRVLDAKCKIPGVLLVEWSVEDGEPIVCWEI